MKLQGDTVVPNNLKTVSAEENRQSRENERRPLRPPRFARPWMDGVGVVVI